MGERKNYMPPVPSWAERSNRRLDTLDPLTPAEQHELDKIGEDSPFEDIPETEK